MADKSTAQPVGVIGSGSFGTALAQLLAENGEVLIYSRKKSVVDSINNNEREVFQNSPFPIRATNIPSEIANKCQLIIPVVPSAYFRSMMKDFAPFLKPSHFLIHGTKGFDISASADLDNKKANLTRSQVHTMSEVIIQESAVVRVGCLAGPNLASEIIAHKPAATVIGSAFREVIQMGQKSFNSNRFHVYGTYDILGAELAGALKNTIAIGSGILGGLNLGKNIQAMLITRGLFEMIYIGKAMGAETRPFIGTAGIGDLVATATSEKSRNYSFGMMIAQGKNVQEILADLPEVAEGVRTLRIACQLASFYKVRVPIMEMLRSIVFDDYDIQKALEYLMRFPYDVDVDIL